MNHAQTAKIIKDLCEKNNITIESMLKICGIRSSLIYDLEKRHFTPSSELLETIAIYFGCSVDYLLGRTDNPNINK